MNYGEHGQCEASAKSTGERCRRPAVGDHGKCDIHGGKTTAPRGEDSPHFKDGTWSEFVDYDDDVVATVDGLEGDISYLQEMRDERMAQYYQALKHLAANEGTEVAMEILDKIEAGEDVDAELIRGLARVIGTSSQGMDRLVARIQALTNDILEAKGEHPERLEVEHSVDDGQIDQLRDDIASVYGRDDE